MTFARRFAGQFGPGRSRVGSVRLALEQVQNQELPPNQTNGRALTRSVHIASRATSAYVLYAFTYRVQKRKEQQRYPRSNYLQQPVFIRGPRSLVTTSYEAR